MSLKRFAETVFHLAFGGFWMLFGGYLVYEKVFLSLQTGTTMERVGLIERSSDPWFFWVWVVEYGFFGSLIFAAGLAYLIYAFSGSVDE